MVNSRRNFLRAASLSGLAAAVKFGLGGSTTVHAQSKTSPSPAPLKQRLGAVDPYDAVRYLNKSVFDPYIHTRFRIQARTPIDAELVEINEDRRFSNINTAGEIPFSLIFLGPANVPLRQDTYLIKHISIGSFALLIVPVGKGPSGVYYEAVFNRSIGH